MDVRIYAMGNRQLKDLLYAQVARVGKALSSPKRLEVLEMLAQGEKAVETVAAEVGMDVKLASAHLKALREAQLVVCRREGKRMFYSLSGSDVAELGLALRQVAQEHLVELQMAVQQMQAQPNLLTQIGRAELLAQAQRGEVIVLDVRPKSEYDTSHLPYARSIPLPELAQHLAELPRNVNIVAYCRGPFCMLSDDAVKYLQAHGYHARKTLDGVSEWQAAGMPL
jgi:rhodanese-related sulfurtransferase/DNA-binding transcriptional ArsR family regulator